jgi:LmbE family N-acetylglucosaminyl deacetylase
LPSIKCNGQVVIVAPHPDDEVIGCGGLIARLVAEGNAPHIVIMTGGEQSHAGCCSIDTKSIVSSRRGLTRNAMAILGVPKNNIHELNFPDGGINSQHFEMVSLQNLLEQLNPQMVFVPHWGEGWPDHITTAKIVKDILKNGVQIYEYCVWMWYYNIWRRLDWHNALKLHMTADERTKKLKAMDAYIKPQAPCGRPWSGVLPSIFVKANRWNRELYFKVK